VDTENRVSFKPKKKIAENRSGGAHPVKLRHVSHALLNVFPHMKDALETERDKTRLAQDIATTTC